MHFGFSYVGLAYLVMLMLPNIIWTKNQPKDYEKYSLNTFMQAWNEFLFALTLTKTNDMRTVPVGINLLMGQHAYEWNQMMAMSVLGSLPILVLFLFFQKYFIAGMTAGAVK